MNFGSNIEKFANDTKKDIDTVTRAIMIGIGNSLVDMSPVGNPDIWKSPPPPEYAGGRFRGNWQFSVGAPADGTLDTKDKSGTLTKNRLAAAINQVSAGKLYYITNNMPYSIRLEFGWSTQAPHGMTRITVDRFKRIVSQSVKAVQ